MNKNRRKFLKMAALLPFGLFGAAQAGAKSNAIAAKSNHFNVLGDQVCSYGVNLFSDDIPNPHAIPIVYLFESDNDRFSKRFGVDNVPDLKKIHSAFGLPDCFKPLEFRLDGSSIINKIVSETEPEKVVGYKCGPVSARYEIIGEIVCGGKEEAYVLATKGRGVKIVPEMRLVGVSFPGDNRVISADFARKFPDERVALN